MLTMKGENMEELTTAESMVMKTIWDHPHEMALQEIMKLTNETYGKDWKSQTVSTYIAKLVKKGFPLGVLDVDGLREKVLGWEN